MTVLWGRAAGQVNENVLHRERGGTVRREGGGAAAAYDSAVGSATGQVSEFVLERERGDR
jgi:hypothetical protein